MKGSLSIVVNIKEVIKLDFTTLLVKPDDYIVITYDCDKVDSNSVVSAFQNIHKCFKDNAIVAIPKGVCLSSMNKEQIIDLLTATLTELKEDNND